MQTVPRLSDDMFRPRKIRSITVYVRLTEEERKTVGEVAADQGYTVPEFLREALRIAVAAARDVKTPPPKKR